MDAQFGFPHEHYHIDCRFYIEPRMGHEYQVHRVHTAAVIRVNGKSPRFLRLELHSVACVGHETGLAFPAEPSLRQLENLIKYEEWYDSYVGRSCAGKRCPHFGTEMLEKDGMLVCPLHELKADLVTMVVVCRGD